jgi:methylenetetrahydrofolate reductase (NADPH)
LRAGVFEKHGIKSISLAGHPEGSKAIGDVRLRQAIIDKNAYAKDTTAKLTLVTQFGFEPEPFIAWEKMLRAEGINSLPIHVGVAGLASFPTLLRFAVECGAGASIRALKSRAGSLAKLATVAQPDDLVLGLARHKQEQPASLIQGAHFFPFGGVKKTAEWLNAIAAGRIELNSDASGFSVR